MDVERRGTFSSTRRIRLGCHHDLIHALSSHDGTYDGCCFGSASVACHSSRYRCTDRPQRISSPQNRWSPRRFFMVRSAPSTLNRIQHQLSNELASTFAVVSHAAAAATCLVPTVDEIPSGNFRRSTKGYAAPLTGQRVCHVMFQ